MNMGWVLELELSKLNWSAQLQFLSKRVEENVQVACEAKRQAVETSIG